MSKLQDLDLFIYMRSRSCDFEEMMYMLVHKNGSRIATSRHVCETWETRMGKGSSSGLSK